MTEDEKAPDDQLKLRRVAVNAGSGAIVVGLLMFFFANDATSSMTFAERATAATIGIVVSLVALRVFFSQFKF